MTNTQVEYMQSRYDKVKLSIENRIATTERISIFDRTYVDGLLMQLWPDTTQDTYTHNVTILHALFNIAKYTHISLHQREELQNLELSYRHITGDIHFTNAMDMAFCKEKVLYEYITINDRAQNQIHFSGIENNLSIRNMLMHKGIQNIVTVLFVENKARSIVQDLFLTNVYSQIFNFTNTNTCSFKNDTETDKYLTWMSENNSVRLIKLLFGALEKYKFKFELENKDDMHVKRVIKILKRNVPELNNVENTIHLGIGLGFDLLKIANMLTASLLKIENHSLPTIIFNND